MNAETHHGTRERVSWSVTIDRSTTLYGEDEQLARDEFARRTRFLHRGKVARLERVAVVESWIQHRDVLETVDKS